MALEDLSDLVPEWCTGLIDDQGFFGTIPHVHGMEGFFGALLIKKTLARRLSENEIVFSRSRKAKTITTGIH